MDSSSSEDLPKGKTTKANTQKSLKRPRATKKSAAKSSKRQKTADGASSDDDGGVGISNSKAGRARKAGKADRGARPKNRVEFISGEPREVNIKALMRSKGDPANNISEGLRIYPGSATNLDPKSDNNDGDGRSHVPAPGDDIHDLVEQCLKVTINKWYTKGLLSVDAGAQDERKKKESSGSDNHLNPDVAPVSDIHRIFDVMINKLLSQTDFAQACQSFKQCGLRVFTMCSGTESPLLALQMIESALQQNTSNIPFSVEHLASAEIEPFKQAYIQRNFDPPILFRDVTEFVDEKAKPHTAYGGTADQPRDVHILIAGSSCIDYSRLNINPKTFGQDGQSYNTLQGVVGYARHHRPSIIILENVDGAPWGKIRDHFRQFDYYGIVMHVDSKDFYIPQTRTRGYMVAFDMKRAKDIGFDCQKAADAVVSTMSGLAQRASSPYTSFIMADDDPELQLSERVMMRMDRTSKSNVKAIDWTACRLRYAGFRVERKLGSGRPYSRWRNNGQCQFPDTTWMSWARIQRERIWDTLDINFLDYVSARDYDAQFKSRWIDLSQNVDRDLDARHWGIVGCITPSGMPFDIRRGGPVFGKEVLALQGIPVQNLSLNKETSRQLQDLAGNAMTSTVIASAILSAIIAATQPAKDTKKGFISMFQSPMDMSRARDSHRSIKIPKSGSLSIESLLQESSNTLLNFTSLDLRQAPNSLVNVLMEACQAVQLCRCEVVSIVKSKGFQYCEFCRHTACNDCSGNPNHSYTDMPSSLIESRQDPVVVRQKLQSALPALLKMNISENAATSVRQLLEAAKDFKERDHDQHDKEASQVDGKQLEIYQNVVIAALQSHIYLHDVKRDRAWKVTYQSSSAILELHIYPVQPPNKTSESDIELLWLLYALPDQDVPAQCWLRDILAYPIARLKSTVHDVFRGRWEIWVPSMEVVPLEIRGETLMASWEKELGLQDDRFRQLEVYEKLHVRYAESKDKMDIVPVVANESLDQICGVYEVRQDCAGAGGSLHKRVEPAEATGNGPMFFFLDPKHLQNSSLDRYVFARKHERLPIGVNRVVVADLQRRWRPFSQTVHENEYTRVNCRIINDWQACDDVRFDLDSKMGPFDVYHSPTIAMKVAKNTPCDTNTTVLLMKLPFSGNHTALWRDDFVYPIDLVDRPAALQDFQWLLRRVSELLPINQSFYARVNTYADDESCACAPRLPELSWRFTRKSNTGKVIIRPFEDDIAATQYERELKARPLAVLADLHCFQDHGVLVVKVNIATLVHRVAARLDARSDTFADVNWCLREHTGTQSAPVFHALTVPEAKSDDPVWPVGDPVIKKTYPDDHNPGNLKPSLWKGQRQTLAWMASIEAGSKTWAQWECEDLNLPSLHLRLDVEGTVETTVRGGIVADQVGAGKTLTSVALVARDLEYKLNDVPSDAMEKSGLIPSRATLILVPDNLVTQWYEEIRKTLSSTECIVLKSTELLEHPNASIQDVKDATLILVSWKIFDNDTAYWNLLRKTCFANNVPEVAGRGLEQWLDCAMSDLKDLVRHSNQGMDATRFWQHRDDGIPEKVERYTKFFKGYEAQKVSLAKKKAKLEKKLDATAVQAHYPDKIKDDSKEARDELDEMKTWNGKKGKIVPLLHLFRFRRLIVDEFTYLEGKSLLATLKLEADNRWMLSGTPPLTTFDSVNCMARLIGTQITGENEKDGIFAFPRAKSNNATDKSYGEEFREQIQLRSPSWLEKRNEITKAFVEKFVRRSQPPKVEIKKFDHYIGVKMSALELCIYFSAYHYLMGQPVTFRGRTQNLTNARTDEQRLVKVLEGANNVEMALICCCVGLLNSFMRGRSNLKDIDICIESIGKKESDMRTLVRKLFIGLKEAFYVWKNRTPEETSDRNPHLVNYLESVVDEGFEDISVVNIVSGLVMLARDDPQRPAHRFSAEPVTKKPDYEYTNSKAYPPVDNLQPNERCAEMVRRAGLLNNWTRQLTEHAQQHRLLTSIKSVIAADKKFRCSGCQKSTAVQDLCILGLCGHLSCQECLIGSPAIMANPQGCVVEGCRASAKDSNIEANHFRTQEGRLYQFGTKLGQVVAKLKEIEKLAPIELTIIFIQFDAVHEQLVASLKAEGVLFKDGYNSVANILTFNDAREKGPKERPRVLILKVDSSDAAGWNLQKCNHVIFVSPLQTKTKYDYEATMTQAVGRVFRYGQKRDVHVYHFVSCNTVEVDMLQHRHGKRFVRLADGEYGLLDPAQDLTAYEDLSGPSLGGSSHGGGGTGVGAVEDAGEALVEEVEEEE